MVINIIKSTVNTKVSLHTQTSTFFYLVYSINCEFISPFILIFIVVQGLEELRVANQFTGQFLGSALEYAIIELLPKVRNPL